MNAFFYSLDTPRFCMQTATSRRNLYALRAKSLAIDYTCGKSRRILEEVLIEEKSIIPLVCLQASDPLSQVLDGGKGGLQIPSRQERREREGEKSRVLPWPRNARINPLLFSHFLSPSLPFLARSLLFPISISHYVSQHRRCPSRNSL